jgi:hypothetical protein
MEAHIRRAALTAAILLVSMGAKHRTANFVVETPDPRFAVQMGEAAEKFRHDLAIEWLGKAIPNWSQPCPMVVQVGANLGAGGSTSFVFDRGEVYGWRMNIQGPADRLLDSVLPHEITHMILATHFRQAVPRWADEGAATSVEHASERNKHRAMLYQFLQTGRGIAFNKLFAMKEYPADIMPLYAQGHSVAEYLIQQRGRRAYIDFVGEGMKTNNWPVAVRNHYGIDDLGRLQNTWLAWVREGSPPLKSRENHPAPAAPIELAQSTTPATSVYAARNRRDTVAANPSPRAPVAPGTMVPVDFSNPRADAPAARFEPNKAAVAASAPSQAGSSVGWRPSGQSPAVAGNLPAKSAVAPPTSASNPYSTVTRPQPFEQPRQVIVEWSKP